MESFMKKEIGVEVQEKEKQTTKKQGENIYTQRTN